MDFGLISDSKEATDSDNPASEVEIDVDLSEHSQDSSDQPIIPPQSNGHTSDDSNISDDHMSDSPNMSDGTNETEHKSALHLSDDDTEI